MPFGFETVHRQIWTFLNFVDPAAVQYEKFYFGKSLATRLRHLNNISRHPCDTSAKFEPNYLLKNVK